MLVGTRIRLVLTPPSVVNEIQNWLPLPAPAGIWMLVPPPTDWLPAQTELPWFGKLVSLLR